MSHTPGPWHTGAGNGEGCIFADNGRMRFDNGTTLYPIASVNYGWEVAEDEANARLIAASPELLDSLRNLLDWCREHTSPLQPNSPHELLVTAHHVIAKATEQS